MIPVADALVRQIRVAEPSTASRAWCWIWNVAADATTSHLDNPNRLIIELRASSDGSAPEASHRRQGRWKQAE